MPFVRNGDIEIHYEVEGEGDPLVLQHGFTGDLGSWRRAGYVEALSSRYRLVLVDARGHGQSGKPHAETEYAPHMMTSDVLAVLDELSIEKCHYWGYSMGAHIGFGLVIWSPDRLRSASLGATGPLKSADPSIIEQRVRGFSEGMDAYVASIEKRRAPMEVGRRESLLKNDPDALSACFAGFTSTHDFRPQLPMVQLPCLIYVGEADGFLPHNRDYAKQIPSAKFVLMTELDHVTCFTESAKILPQFESFLAAQS